MTRYRRRLGGEQPARCWPCIEPVAVSILAAHGESDPGTSLSRHVVPPCHLATYLRLSRIRDLLARQITMFYAFMSVLDWIWESHLGLVIKNEQV